MAFDVDLLSKVLSPILTLVVGAIIKYYTQERPRIISFFGHISSFTIKNPEGTRVHTHSIIVRNIGRKSAHNVRLGHNFLPEDINVFPSVQYLVEKNPEGSSEIIIPILVPKEQITISYLYFPPVTVGQINSYTKSDECLAKIISVIPIPEPHKVVVGAVWFLMFTGLSFLMYWLIRSFVWLLY